MRLLLFLILTFNFSFIVMAQNDPSIPTTNSGGGGGTKIAPKEEKSNVLITIIGHSKMLQDHNILLNNLSARWEECGGDPMDTPDLFSIETNLLLVYESAKKAGSQPDCDQCQKRATRYQCMIKDDGLKDLKIFVNDPYALEFIKIHYKLNRRHAKKLLKPLKQIANSKPVVQEDPKEDE